MNNTPQTPQEPRLATAIVVVPGLPDTKWYFADVGDEHVLIVPPAAVSQARDLCPTLPVRWDMRKEPPTSSPGWTIREGR